jgi:hypothetical protein
MFSSFQSALLGWRGAPCSAGDDDFLPEHVRQELFDDAVKRDRADIVAYSGADGVLVYTRVDWGAAEAGESELLDRSDDSGPTHTLPALSDNFLGQADDPAGPHQTNALCTCGNKLRFGCVSPPGDPVAERVTKYVFDKSIVGPRNKGVG